MSLSAIESSYGCHGRDGSCSSRTMTDVMQLQNLGVFVIAAMNPEHVAESDFRILRSMFSD